MECIEKHRQANFAFYDALEVVPGTLNPDPNLEDRFGHLEADARAELVATRPKTVAGLAALIRYVDGMSKGEIVNGTRDICFGENELCEIVSAAREIFDNYDVELRHS